MWGQRWYLATYVKLPAFGTDDMGLFHRAERFGVHHMTVLTERLGLLREQQAVIVKKLDDIQGQIADFREFRNTTARDVVELRREAQSLELKLAEANRTINGLGKAFDEYRDTEALERARLQGQIVLLRWVAGIVATLTTPLAIQQLLAWLGL